MDTKTKPRFMLYVVFLCLFFKTYFSEGVDTISQGYVLSGDSTVISAGGVFQLGFFKPGPTPNYYIGIWYVEDPSRTGVWVANRENPVSLSSELRISDGNLILFDESKVPVWSTVTNSTNTSRSVQAILLDDGNLVLNDIGSSPPKPLWQSFDHPTDTWLPGSKIEYNKITKRSQVLTSWKNSEDPAPGRFSLQLEPSDNSFRIFWNRSKNYWTSGPWNGQYFSSLPEMRLAYIFNYSFVSNQNSSYFIYNLKNTSNTRSRCVLNISGQIKQLNLVPNSRWNLFWSQPMQQCEVYSLCGAYGNCNDTSLPSCRCLKGFKPKSQSDWDLEDYSGGCQRATNLGCGNSTLVNGDRDGFLKMLNVSMPENNHSVQAKSSGECESRCLNNCSCTAYSYDRNGCSIWAGDLINLKQNSQGNISGSTLYIRLAASEFQSPKREPDTSTQSKGSSHNPKLFIILFGTMAAVAITSGTACYVYYLRRKKMASRQGEERIKDFICSGEFKDDEKKGIEVPFVVLESILAATDNFSEVNKLGQGGFGPVYKGKFPGGQEIAIKRLLSSSGQGLQEFKNEVLLIAKLQHRNLVRLLGYCVEGDEKMLLYEYMPNKSLDSFIFGDHKQCILLNWEMHFNIILGIARGLHYLHHDSRLRVIHRDLKTSNVLLDEEMNPKISDFGLAKIFGGKQTEANTNKVVGTYGYMSPEYALQGLFSIKSDVFSFGVVVLEIISGKRNTGFYQSEQGLSLLDYAWKLWKEDKALDLMDPTLSETCNENEFLRCFNVGLLCVQDDPNDRPTMSNVVVMLGSENGSLPSPKQPAFVVKRPLSGRASSDDKPLSNNELTDSLNEGR